MSVDTARLRAALDEVDAALADLEAVTERIEAGPGVEAAQALERAADLARAAAERLEAAVRVAAGTDGPEAERADADDPGGAG